MIIARLMQQMTLFATADKFESTLCQYGF